MDWYESWTGAAEDKSVAEIAAAAVEKAKAEAECPAEVKAKASELGVVEFVGCNAFRDNIKAGKTREEATSAAVKEIAAFKERSKKGPGPAAQPKPPAASYAAPAAAAAPAPAAEPKPVEEPWWSTSAAKAAAVAAGAGVLTLALLRRK